MRRRRRAVSTINNDETGCETAVMSAASAVQRYCRAVRSTTVCREPGARGSRRPHASRSLSLHQVAGGGGRGNVHVHKGSTVRSRARFHRFDNPRAATFNTGHMAFRGRTQPPQRRVRYRGITRGTSAPAFRNSAFPPPFTVLPAVSGPYLTFYTLCKPAGLSFAAIGPHGLIFTDDRLKILGRATN